MFLPSYLPQIQEELDWRSHKDPYEFLQRWPWGARHWQAMAELDAVQRREGFIARLTTPSPYGPRYLRGNQFWSAQWGPDGTQVLTGSATTAIRWNASTGSIVAIHGAERRRDVEDAYTWGYGFPDTAWYDGGRAVVAMTPGPHSLWFFSSAPHPPVLLEGEGYEALTARDGRIALIKYFEHGMIMTADGRSTARLPHEDVSTIALTPDDGAITASRSRVQWWRNAQPVTGVTIRATYNPVGFSADARWALVLTQRSVELWSTDTGRKLELPHEGEPTAVCAAADVVATGTQEGQVHLWRASDGALIRSIRASTARIDLLDCAPGRLLTLSYNRTDARLWHLEGRPRQGPMQEAWPEPHLHWAVKAGADIDLPGSAPALVRWLDAGAVNGLNPYAAGGLLALLGAAWWLARAARRPKNSSTRMRR